MGHEVADVVLKGGRVWAGPGRPTGLAIARGRIVAVGSDAEVAKLAGRGTRQIELRGRRVVPGFIDNHTHFLSGGLALGRVQLRDATRAEFTKRIGNQARLHPGEWVQGGGWDHELWGGDLPRREWLDPVTPGTPVFVSRLDLHMGLANSRALETAGITAETPDPPGGTIVRGSDGQPTGILKDTAQSLVSRVIPAPSEADLDRALQIAAAHAVERGVTMVTDMGSWDHLSAYRRAHARGDLSVRIYSVVPLSTWRQMSELVAQAGRGDDRVRWGGVKAFVDGSLGSTTAWFHEPFDDEPGNTGLVLTDPDQLRRDIVAADAAGLHVMVHAIGDRANDWILDTFLEAARTNGPRDRRFRVEHAQHLKPEAIPRFGAQQVIASMQPYHAIDDGRWAERRIGADRIKTTYAFRALLDAGARLAFGSDWTVAPLDPLLGVYAAVTRRPTDGSRPQGWVPDQKIRVEEAMRAYTANSAYASYCEDLLGTLDEGKYADLVVLSDDIFTIDPVGIEQVRVDLTMIDGQVVYERGILSPGRARSSSGP